MRFLLILALAGLTSVGGYLYGRRVLGLPKGELSSAWRSVLEWVWVSLVFFTLNLLLALTGILSSRVALGSFISLYDVSDIPLLFLSLFQGVVFQLWRREAAHHER